MLNRGPEMAGLEAKQERLSKIKRVLESLSQKNSQVTCQAKKLLVSISLVCMIVRALETI